MNWVWIIAAVVVLISAMSIARHIRRGLIFFAIAFAGLMLLHFQSHPGEAMLGLGSLGGGLAMMRPLRRIVARISL